MQLQRTSNKLNKCSVIYSAMHGEMRTSEAPIVPSDDKSRIVCHRIYELYELLPYCFYDKLII